MPLLGDTLSVSSFGSRGTKGSRRSKESGQFWSALRREHFWLEPVPNFKCGSAISLLIHPVPVYVILRVGETKGLGSDNHNKVREKNCHGCFVYNFDYFFLLLFGELLLFWKRLSNFLHIAWMWENKLPGTRYRYSVNYAWLIIVWYLGKETLSGAYLLCNTGRKRSLENWLINCKRREEK